MKKLLIATHNPAKFEEISSLLRKNFYMAQNDVELVSLSNLRITKDVQETGKTFEENAVLKAEFFCKLTGLPTIADDGGLEIDYLDGLPGVKSRRWIDGSESSDEELISHTLAQLKGISKEKRTGKFCSAVAFAIPNGTTYVERGCTSGVIAEKVADLPHKKGFPYRQIFYLSEIGKYYHEDDMTEEENRAYNHRIKALKKLSPALNRAFAL